MKRVQKSETKKKLGWNLEGKIICYLSFFIPKYGTIYIILKTSLNSLIDFVFLSDPCMGDYLQMTLNYNVRGPQPGIILRTEVGKTLAKLST